MDPGIASEEVVVVSILVWLCVRMCCKGGNVYGGDISAGGCMGCVDTGDQSQ